MNYGDSLVSMPGKKDAHERREEKPEGHPTKNNGPGVMNRELFHVKHFLSRI